jgi:DNA-binding NarL/FixJ family response regulator
MPRLAARAMLTISKDFALCGEAASGQEAIDLVPKLKPDLVLMDVHMSGLDGPATTRLLLELNSDLKIVAWTVSDSGDDLLRMMQAGCAGYVLKDVGPDELHRALRAALKSETPVPRRMIPGVLRRVAQQAPPPPPTDIALTSRELQVLRGLARGLSTKRISQEFGLAIPTVETHLSHVYRKLGVGNRGEAVSTALKLNLISLADV